MTCYLPVGPAGLAVAANAGRLRQARGLSYRSLSEKLADVGRPLPPAALSRLECGERHADVDDLAALATVLGTTTADLLKPHHSGPPSPEANARFTCAALAEAIAQVAARFHDIDPPGRDGGIPDHALADVLTLWTASMLAVLPRDRALGILETLGLRAAAGQSAPEDT